MDFRAMALSATLAGSVLLTGLTYTGTIDLNSIKSKAFGWATNVNTSVDSTKAMLDKFNTFKADVQAQINEKIAKINSLNDAIALLNTKVGNGQISLEQANTEIARLNEEIQKANQEIADLKAQIDTKDAEVSAKMTEMKTSSDMDVNLTLNTQNPDVTPASGTPTGGEQSSQYASNETAIKNAILSNHPAWTDLTVTMTDTTVTLSSQYLSSYPPEDFISSINANAGGKTVTSIASGQGTNTVVYNIQ